MLRLLATALPVLGLSQSLKQFTINLDLPPGQRHREVARAFKDVYPQFMDGWEASLKRKITAEERADWMANHNIKQEYQDEIKGFVEEMDDAHVTFERVVLFNLMYELNFPTFCSGVLAADSSGRILHGRNLDFVMPYRAGGIRRSISDLSVNLTYVKNGTPTFEAVATAGYVGLQTALKLSGHYKWSFQQNSHMQNNRLWNLDVMKDGAVPFGFVMRDMIVQEQGDVDFKTLLFNLETTRFSAPNYFLIAGQEPWEGVAMEVERNYSNFLDNGDHMQVIAPQIGRWFLVQTNNRIWDEPEDDRRPAANEMMSLLGGPWKMDEETLMGMMRSKPLFNDYTTLSFVAVPASGYSKGLTEKDSFQGLNLLAKNRKFKLALR